MRRLRSFITLVEEGSFTRAAKVLRISQPSLSQQVRVLENEVGGALLERLPRGVRLTPAGQAFLPEAHATVRAAERAELAARRAIGLEEAELEVATLLSLAVGLLPAAITAWHAEHPEVAIRLREYTHRTLLEDDVRNGVGDIALGPMPRAWDGALEPLGYEELLVVLPRSDPLAQRERIPLAELADRRWILFEHGHGLNDVITHVCRSAGFQPREAVRTTQVAAAARLAAAGVGTALLFNNVIGPGLEAAVVPLDPPHARKLAAYARREWTPVAHAFLGALRRAPFDSVTSRDRVLV